MQGRKVVVTGGAQGIGYATALAIAQQGGAVALLDLDDARLAKAQQSLIAAVPSAIVDVARCDVSQYDQVLAARDHLAGRWGAADGLVNNAGIVDRASAMDLTPALWQSVIDVNLSAVFYCSQIFGVSMLEAGSGGIVNIASMSGLIVNRPQPHVAYNVSKAGVIMLTKSLAAEWAPNGVRVNAVAPGYIRTPLSAENMKTEMAKQYWTGGTPMARPGEPSEVADAIVFLLAETASFITGSTIVIDGGYTVW